MIDGSKNEQNGGWCNGSTASCTRLDLFRCKANRRDVDMVQFHTPDKHTQ